MKISKKDLKKFILKEFKEINAKTTPQELAVLLSDFSFEKGIKHKEAQSFLSAVMERQKSK